MPPRRPARPEVLVEVSERGTLTLPKQFRSAVSLFLVRPREDGVLELVPQRTVDAAQTWFWAERWQKMERAADADVKAGRVRRFRDAEEFLTELEKL